MSDRKPPEGLPTQVFSGSYASAGHVQGIVTDGVYLYYSFTTMLLKTDLYGKPVGSVTGLCGHLGCIAWSEEDCCVYGSLEYKNDAVGRGILKGLGKTQENPDAFYIVRFDAGKITAMNLDAITSGIMTAVKLDEVGEDYAYDHDGVKHRYGCSGIDGITVVPSLAGERSILVAYGIYGDITRRDNDHQVLLRFNAAQVKSKFKQLTLSDSAPGVRADDRLFVYTGNTTYGIQNLEYDSYTGCIFAAVYSGKKPEFPNWSLYFIAPTIVERDGKTFLPLAERGEGHPSGIRGCNFRYGATGMVSLGDGYYYFSEDGSKDGNYYTTVRMYQLEGDSNFSPV